MTYDLRLSADNTHQPKSAGTISMKTTMDANGNWYRAPFIRDEHGDKPLPPLTARTQTRKES